MMMKEVRRVDCAHGWSPELGGVSCGQVSDRANAGSAHNDVILQTSPGVHQRVQVGVVVASVGSIIGGGSGRGMVAGGGRGLAIGVGWCGGGGPGVGSHGRL